MDFTQQQNQSCIETSISSKEARLENTVYSGADPPSDCFMVLLVESGQKATMSTSWMITVAKAFFNDTDGVLTVLRHFLHCCYIKDKTELSGSHCKPHGFILAYLKTNNQTKNQTKQKHNFGKRLLSVTWLF